MESRKPPSIRKQLLSWLMIPIVSLCLVSAGATYFIAIQITTQAYDAALIESARELANRLTLFQNQVGIDLPPAALAIFREDNIDKFYYAVVENNGHFIAGDIPLVQAILREGRHHNRFEEMRVDGASVRVAYLPSTVPMVANRKVDIFVAETVKKRQALVNQILVAVVLPQVLLITLSALAVWFGVARGLAPLSSVKAAIASRSQWNLNPVFEVDSPLEIRPLVDAIDDLLSRLNKDIEGQRRFIANAAHQLRTPLAGLKTQTELAMRQKTMDDLHHTLNQVHRSADNVTRLVNQLLTLARLEPSNALLQPHSQIDLNHTVREATADLVPYALNKEIDLGFEESTEPAYILGDQVAIRELVANLIDNAIRYTQESGKVTVKLRVNSGVSLLVEDDGPGIPTLERDRVFERFYRVLGNNVTGSGLGLAIVKEIAQAHRAEISLTDNHDGRGTVALVQFPAVVPGALAVTK